MYDLKFFNEKFEVLTHDDQLEEEFEKNQKFKNICLRDNYKCFLEFAHLKNKSSENTKRLQYYWNANLDIMELPFVEREKIEIEVLGAVL